MARTFTTCSVHPGCQVESRDGLPSVHHAGQLQPRSPIAPEARPIVIVHPRFWPTAAQGTRRVWSRTKRRTRKIVAPVLNVVGNAMIATGRSLVRGGRRLCQASERVAST